MQGLRIVSAILWGCAAPPALTHTVCRTKSTRGLAILFHLWYDIPDADVAEWQTHRTQNAAGNRVSSSLTIGTKTGHRF